MSFLASYIRHLGNFIDCSNSDMVDCGIKKGLFIGYVKKTP